MDEMSVRLNDGMDGRIQGKPTKWTDLSPAHNAHIHDTHSLHTAHIPSVCMCILEHMSCSSNCKKTPWLLQSMCWSHTFPLSICVCGQARAKASDSAVAWGRTAASQVFPLAPPGPRANHCGGWVLWLSRPGSLALVKTCTHSGTVVKFVKSI
jgi:hypothetical protein